MEGLKRIFIILSLMMIIFPSGSYSNAEEGKIPEGYKQYINKEFKVSLYYPKEWKPNTDYSPPRYERKEGFFLIAARNGLSLDGVADNDAYYKLSPYGDNPTIKKIFKVGVPSQMCHQTVS